MPRLRPLRSSILAALPLTVLLASTPARAEPNDAEVARRLAFLEARLEHGERAASLWWNLWYAGYLTLTVGQGAVAAAVKDKGLRADAAVGAVASSLGVAPLGLFAFPARNAGTTLRAIPEGTPAERRRKLAVAEHLLEKSAEAEAFGRSWLPHVGGVVVAAAQGLLLGFVYKRGWSALTSVGASLVVSEAQIWTQPTAAVDDWKAYRAGALGGGPAAGKGVSWGVRLAPGGIGIGGSF